MKGEIRPQLNQQLRRHRAGLLAVALGESTTSILDGTTADPSDNPLFRRLVDLIIDPRTLAGLASDLVADGLLWLLPALVALLSVLLLGAPATLLLTRIRDRRLATGGRRLRILPPPNLPLRAGEALWTALHGLIRPKFKRTFLGQPFFSWEVAATAQDVGVSIWFPEAVPVTYIERAVESAWPGASLVEAGQSVPLPPSGSLKTCRLELASPEWLPIGGESDSDPLRLALAAMSNLSEGEGCTLQILARPATSDRGQRLIRRFTRAEAKRLLSRNQRSGSEARVAPVLRDLTADTHLKAVHTKCASPLWECAVRLAVSSNSHGQAVARVHSLATAFAMFEGMNGLRRRRLPGGAGGVASRRFTRPFVLSVPELACLATFPSTPIAGLDLAGARILAPAQSLPSSGRVLGTSNSGVAGRPVAISVSDSRHHLHVLGETGTGKSTLLANLVLQDAAAARSAVVVDPKGDLIESILGRLPEDAEKRTCVIDPTDASVAVGLNVLEGEDPELVVDHIVALFKRMYEHHWGPRSDDILRAACLTLTQIPGATIAEVPLLLTSPAWRRAIRYSLSDPFLRHFWEQFDAKTEAQRSQDIAPLMNKVRAFLMRGAIRTILGQSRPRRNLEDLLENGGLILVRIPKGQIGEDTSRLLGGLVIARVWQACMKRAGQPEERRRDSTLYVDEMHNYLTLPRSFEDLLAEARGYRLSLVLAHQHLGQLNRDVRDAIGANARTKVIFACSPDDAAGLEKHFTPLLTAHDLSHLPAFTAACRPCLNGANGNPFTFVTTRLQAVSTTRSEEVKAASGRLFGTHRETVEKEIRNRQLKPELNLLPRSEEKGSGSSGGLSSGSLGGSPAGSSSSSGPDDPEGSGEAA